MSVGCFIHLILPRSSSSALCLRCDQGWGEAKNSLTQSLTVFKKRREWFVRIWYLCTQHIPLYRSVYFNPHKSIMLKQRTNKCVSEWVGEWVVSEKCAQSETIVMLLYWSEFLSVIPVSKIIKLDVKSTVKAGIRHHGHEIYLRGFKHMFYFRWKAVIALRNLIRCQI